MKTNWKTVKLGEVCETTSGGTPNRKIPEYFGGATAWVKSGELDQGVVTKTEETISEAGLKNSSAKIQQPGTVLLALYGATVGKCALLGIEAATNQAICCIRPNENLSNRFLIHFLQSHIRQIIQRSVGGAQPNISQQIVRDLEIPLPPLGEQKRIASILDAADALRARRRESLLRLDALAHSLFLDAFGDPATNPKGWDVVKLGEVCEIERTSIEPQKIKSGTLYVGLENIQKGGEFLDVRSVQNGDLASSKFSFTNRHILYGKLRPYLNKIGIPNFCGVCSTDILPILPAARVSQNFLLYYLRMPAIVELATTRSSGANLPRISPKALLEFPLPLPPLSHQQKFAERIAQLEAVRLRMETSRRELDGLFASLQSRAFSGELTDEPRA